MGQHMPTGTASRKPIKIIGLTKQLQDGVATSKSKPASNCDRLCCVTNAISKHQFYSLTNHGQITLFCSYEAMNSRKELRVLEGFGKTSELKKKVFFFFLTPH